MKKLTNTQKNILKKKVLRISNIVGLIVGGLSFLIVLYAIIAGSLNSNVPETADVSEGAPSPSPLVQPALTPPSSYHLEFSPYAVDATSYFAWQHTENTAVALFEENIATIDYYSNSYYWHDMLLTINVYAPTTTLVANEYDTFSFQGDYLGSAASSPAFQRFLIVLDNRNSAQSFLFYADFSSSNSSPSASVILFDNNNVQVATLNNFVAYYYTFRPLYIPSFSKIVLSFDKYTYQQYLNALYFHDIGAYAYETGFDDGGYHGYEDGYDVGYADGYDVGVPFGYDIGLGYGYNDGYDDGTIDGYDLGHTAGYNDGYEDGVGMTVASADMVENAFDLIYAGAQSVDKILSISIFGSINLGMLLFTPLIVGISLAVIKVIKG